jgi:hypothetical protein
MFIGDYVLSHINPVCNFITHFVGSNLILSPLSTPTNKSALSWILCNKSIAFIIALPILYACLLHLMTELELEV